MRGTVTRSFTFVVVLALVTAPLATTAATAAPARGDAPVDRATAPAPAGATGDQADWTGGHPSAVGTETTCSPGGEAPPDPDEDVLGWEAGCWYNESVAVDGSDGLSQDELQLVLSRAMARVERIRQLEFKRRPEVEFMPESEWREILRELDEQRGDPTTAERLHQNVKHEALFLVGEDTDYFRVREGNRGTTLAFTVTTNHSLFREHGLDAGDVAILTSGGDVPRVDEWILGHELVHVLQVQHGLHDEVSSVERNTSDGVLARDGIVEGDATYVHGRYEERCTDDWSCLTAPRRAPPSVANWGLIFYRQTTYGSGPNLVADVHDRGGWDAVDDLYRTPPETTEQLIHPETYPDEVGARITVEDRSTDGWRLLELEDGIDHATFGEAGIFIMFYYPSYRTRQPVVVDPNHIFSAEYGYYDFDHPVSDGWNGDRLVPFVTDDSGSTNETGYVWKTRWDTADDAAEFDRAYRELLRHHDAEQVGRDTFVVPESTSRTFEDAFHVIRDGQTVIVVNAPTVDDLSKVRSGVEVETPTPTPSPTATATGTPTRTAAPTDDGTATATTGPAASPTSTGTSTPGFGPAVAVLALLAAALLARRSRAR